MKSLLIPGPTLLHLRNIDHGNGPYLPALARSQPRVRGSLRCGDGIAKGRVRRGKGNDRVEVLLGGDGPAAATITFCASAPTRGFGLLV